MGPDWGNFFFLESGCLLWGRGGERGRKMEKHIPGFEFFSMWIIPFTAYHDSC